MRSGVVFITARSSMPGVGPSRPSRPTATTRRARLGPVAGERVGRAPDRAPGMLVDRDPDPLDLRLAARKCRPRASPKSSIASGQVLAGQGVGRVLHRVGRDDRRVVARRVGRREVALQRDRDRQVADAMRDLVADDLDQPDRGLAVARWRRPRSRGSLGGFGRDRSRGDRHDVAQRPRRDSLARSRVRAVCEHRDKRRPRAAVDEDAEPEAEASLVRGVEPLEVGDRLGGVRGRSPARGRRRRTRSPAARRAGDGR